MGGHALLRLARFATLGVAAAPVPKVASDALAASRSPMDQPAPSAPVRPGSDRTGARPRTPVITVAGLTKRFPGAARPAVEDLAFAVNEGEMLAIVGPSGCGKTTTLRLLAGFEAPDAGEVRIRDRLVAAPGAWLPPEQRGLGMVFQQFALFPHLTAEGNVAYGLKGLRREGRQRRAREMLALVGMAEFARRYPHQLSGGQQQRVALARALAPEPLVLLMDEPFGSLDAALRRELRREVKAILAQLNATTIIVTHDQEEAFTVADRMLILRDGRLEQLNTPDNIYHRPATRFVAAFAGLADFVPAQVRDGRVETELGEFAFDGLAPAQEVDLLLRPDDVDLQPDPAGQGRIVAREFKGADNLYSVRLPSGRTLRSVQPSLSVFQIGQRVLLRAHPDHVLLFAREEEGAA